MKNNNDASGMKGQRSRNQDGQLRKKRSDTHMGSVEKNYDIELNVRSDMHLGNFLVRNGYSSLSQLLNDL